MTIPWPPLDLDEVRRIARVHHGFLYQHVAAAHALVRHILGKLNIVRLVIERDEDLELHNAEQSSYLQVKAREALQFSDLSRAVLRLHRARIAHEAGERAGAFRGGFVIGGSLGPELAGRSHTSRDVVLEKVRALATSKKLDPEALVATWNSLVWSTPGDVSTDLGDIVIHESAEFALRDLEADVAKIPGLADHARTSALALVTSVHAIAADTLAGFPDRVVRPDQVPLLVRTIEERAANLPALPRDFVPLGLDAAALARGTATALLGISGSGKTTQLTWLALAEPNALYTRPSPNETDALDAQVVGQLVAALGATSTAPVHLGPRRRVEIIAPLLAERLVIVDNCHLLPKSDVLEALFSRALQSGCRLLLTGQPRHSDGQPTARSIRRLFARAPRVVDVPPWTAADVTRYLARRGRPADPIAAETLRSTAAGHPLTVADIVDLAETVFEGNLEEAARSVRRGDAQSTLRAVTAAHFQSLPEHARRVAAVLATVRVPLSAEELAQFLPPEVIQPGVTELRDHRYVLTDLAVASQRLRLLEAYVPEAALAFHSLFSVAQQRAIHESAITVIEERRRRTESPFLVPPLLIHRAYASHVSEVVKSLTSDGPQSTEALARFGVGTPLVEALDDILRVATAPHDRFFILDAVLYLNEQEDLRRDSSELLAQMRREYEAISLPDAHTSLVFAQKAMRIEGWKDVESARAHLARAMPLLEDDWRRTIFLGEFASALFHHRHYVEALELLRANVHAYLEQAGVDAIEFWGWTRRELSENLDNRITAGDMSRLADTIESAAMTLERLGDDPRRLYTLAIDLYSLLGRTKAVHKAAFMWLRQSLRDPATEVDANQQLVGMLEQARANGDTGKFIPVLTLLAAAAELQGRKQEAARILAALADYDPEEVQSDLEFSRAMLRIPRRPVANSSMTFLFMYRDYLETLEPGSV